MAQQDLVVDPYSLIRIMRESLLVLEEQADLPLGSPRPGVVQLDLGDGPAPLLRMPRYEAAGHMVTLRAPGEFFDDVVEWMGL